MRSPWEKTPEVFTMNEVPDLRELIAVMGVALGMEGLMGQGKNQIFLQLLCTRM